MKKLLYTLLTVSALAITACTGNSNKTGGHQADSGNAGSSGASDTTTAASSSSPAVQSGTSGTDTSSNGKGTATPTVDTPKTNPK